jgi:hypothetical protein
LRRLSERFQANALVRPAATETAYPIPRVFVWHIRSTA